MAAVRIHRLTTTGYDVLESPTPAVVMGTQLLGAPRYPSLRGIMQARQKPVESWALADLDIDPSTVGSGAATTTTLDGGESRRSAREQPSSREPADAAVAQIVEFLADRRLI